MIELRVNGTIHRLDIDPQMPLLWALRDHVGLTGTKYGCGIGQCGACTVLLGSAAVRACSLPVAGVGGQPITTIEGLTDGPHAKIGRAVQDAWIELDVVQCGFCQSGQIMQATALLADNPSPDPAAVAAGMSGNICRCATYARIRRAIDAAARALA
jgi:isoquinoline 1-oxidoreductase alpha subunit